MSIIKMLSWVSKPFSSGGGVFVKHWRNKNLVISRVVWIEYLDAFLSFPLSSRSSLNLFIALFLAPPSFCEGGKIITITIIVTINSPGSTATWYSGILYNDTFLWAGSALKFWRLKTIFESEALKL